MKKIAQSKRSNKEEKKKKQRKSRVNRKHKISANISLIIYNINGIKWPVKTKYQNRF